MKPELVKFDGPMGWVDGKWRITHYWQIWQGGGAWYSIKYGWLAPVQRNVKHYSRFRSEAAAQKVLDRLVAA